MTEHWDDIDPVETKEWLDALASVVKFEGAERAKFILDKLAEKASQKGVNFKASAIETPYCNTITPMHQPDYPGDLVLEAKIEAINRWNAIAMVIRAKHNVGGVGGHLASYASIATLYEVGFNHFFKGASQDRPGDLIYFQGHSSEGNYARAYLEGRLTDEKLHNFRQEVGGQGLSSYPHPWLMPDFWQFATVSLGLGALQAIYQARFLKYLQNRAFVQANDRKVWVFCGDGEMDEPESIAGLTLAAREKLDNLVYVVNCNLQRLDGLVRSNHKIIQELEALFSGAKWHVIKVVWDSQWDKLFAKDKKGLLLKRLGECVDGDLQNAYVRGAAYTRDFISGENPEIKTLLEDLTDDDLLLLHRGGHDPIKVFAAYAAAVKHKDQPTVILAQTVKGYGLGTAAAEGRNIAHNHLDMTLDEAKIFRDRFKLPLSDEQLANFDFYKPDDNAPEMKYLHAQRQALGGYLPARIHHSQPLTVPPLSAFDAVLKGTGDRSASTTMMLGRILNVILKDAQIGQRVVPIFSDEVRTFGLEALFRQIGIYSPCGQLYVSEDKEQLMNYHETPNGQLLEEGITEAGCMASWVAAATAYSTHQVSMIPFFTFYSMFGFQRVGDFIWAAADMRARGFLIGATAGRTTLEGEGLQHQDGQSLLTAAGVPSCRAYDPTFGYEMAVIVQDGLQKMFAEEQDIFYYITAMNEKYEQPKMPEGEGVAEGIIKGMYLLHEKEDKDKAAQLQLLGSGAILREVIAAQKLLAKDFSIRANVWSVTSFNELRRDGLAVQRNNMFTGKKQVAYVEKVLSEHAGPIVAATDYIRTYAEQIRPFISAEYVVLGTDGYGRSDTRDRLRHFFEVDRFYIVLAALHALGDFALVKKALKLYNIDTDKPNPVTV